MCPYNISMSIKYRKNKNTCQNLVPILCKNCLGELLMIDKGWVASLSLFISTLLFSMFYLIILFDKLTGQYLKLPKSPTTWYINQELNKKLTTPL